jgi:imidazolonepropionase-like amidohydrolase
MKLLTSVCAALFAVAPAAAQAECTVLFGARVFDSAGALSSGTTHLVVDDASGTVVASYDGEFPGAATANGRGTWSDRDCAWVDATGKQIARGFVDPISTLGLVEVGMEGRTRNQDPGGPERIRASFDASEAYDPSSVVLASARREGITSVVIHPSGGMVSGVATWVTLTGTTQAEAVADAPLAMRMSSTTSSRAGGLDALRDLFADVRDYEANRSSYDRNGRREYIASKRDLEALIPVIQRRMPIVLSADRASDIEALLRFAEEERVELVIDGGAEAHLHAAALATAKIAVIVRPLVYGAGSFDQIQARRDGTKILDEAGVTFLFSARSAHFSRKLRQLAGNAVREGLAHASAMVALTSGVDAAFKTFGHTDLRTGAVADVVVWSGDPLEIASRPERMFIRGAAVSLDGRHEALLERYRTLPGSPMPALTLP